MKLRRVQKIRPITLEPGDTMTLTYYDSDGSSTVLQDHEEMGVSMAVDAIALLDLERGDIPGYGRGIGSVLLESTTPLRA